MKGKTEPPRFVPEHRHLAGKMHPAQLGLLQRGHHLPLPPPFQQTAIFLFPLQLHIKFCNKSVHQVLAVVCITAQTVSPKTLETYKACLPSRHAKDTFRLQRMQHLELCEAAAPRLAQFHLQLGEGLL